MVFWSADPTSTDPPSYATTAESDETLAFDATALLVADDPPSAPESVLYRVVDNGADVAVALTDAAALGEGNIVTQRLRDLAAGTTYRLRVTFATSGNRRAMTLVVQVVE